MIFVVNDLFFVGKEGKFVISCQVCDCLQCELFINVVLCVEDIDLLDCFVVSGCGELYFGILIEIMCCEGYEFQVFQLQVIYCIIDGIFCELVEILVMDVLELVVGSCIEKLGICKGEMQNMEISVDGCIQLEFIVFFCGLIGFCGEFIWVICGEGIMSYFFYEYWLMMGEFDIC